MCNTQNLLVQFPRSNVTDRFRDYFDLHFISSVKVSTQYLTPWGMFRNHASQSVRPIDATLSRTCQERLREDCRLQKSWDNCVCGEVRWFKVEAWDATRMMVVGWRWWMVATQTWTTWTELTWHGQGQNYASLGCLMCLIITNTVPINGRRGRDKLIMGCNPYFKLQCWDWLILTHFSKK